jgi:hypothetical protein
LNFVILHSGIFPFWAASFLPLPALAPIWQINPGISYNPMTQFPPMRKLHYQAILSLLPAFFYYSPPLIGQVLTNPSDCGLGIVIPDANCEIAGAVQSP